MRKQSWQWFGGVCLVLAVAGSCGGTTAKNPAGSESHFLDGCGNDGCPDGLECVCGVCTRLCKSIRECSSLSNGARCVELADVPTAMGCGQFSAVQAVCEQPCSEDEECSELGDDFGCSAGVCRVSKPEPEPAPDTCELPIDSGSCLAYMPRFAFDAMTGQCKQFVYGGCGGNANRFDSLGKCEETCGLAPPETFACTADSDCVRVETQYCGCEPRAITEYTAVKRGFESNYQRPEDIVCTAGCPSVDPSQVMSQNYGARCVSGRCEMFDVRNSEFSECTPEVGCKLVGGLECCNECVTNGQTPIAIRSDVQLFTELECGLLP
ncbi:MAG TPA: BPTI/Kunitz domain-containing protein, partial [Polyangiaceae bacterium]